VGKAQRAHHSRMISDRWWARCRFAHPAVLRTDLLPAQAQSRCIAAANQHDGQITSDFQKSCQFQESEIFRFTRGPNQSRNSARLTADEGRWPSSRTRGEMRWTRELQLTCVAQAYGKVVWESSGGEGECRGARGAPHVDLDAFPCQRSAPPRQGPSARSGTRLLPSPSPKKKEASVERS